jgi:hypothetical protein
MLNVLTGLSFLHILQQTLNTIDIIVFYLPNKIIEAMIYENFKIRITFQHTLLRVKMPRRDFLHVFFFVSLFTFEFDEYLHVAFLHTFRTQQKTAEWNVFADLFKSFIFACYRII